MPHSYYAPPPRERTPPIGDLDYWGKMITDAQHPPQPMPMFRKLLLAIAEYIKEEIDPKDVKALTPVKMSAFYRAVGGDIDDFFVDDSPQHISEVYTTLGCTHSLEPGDDDFHPPAIPALTPRGFVIWQTVQLLLDPAEHIPYIRKAVSDFKLKDPDTGERFPREIPEDAFPRTPDEETRRWHNEVFAKAARAKAEQAKAQGKTSSVPPPPEPGTSGIVDEDEHSEWWAGSYYKPRHRRRRSHAHTAHEPPNRRSVPADFAVPRHTHVYHPPNHDPLYPHINIHSPKPPRRNASKTSTADATVGSSTTQPKSAYLSPSSDEEDRRGRRRGSAMPDEPDIEYVRPSRRSSAHHAHHSSSRPQSRSHSRSAKRPPKQYYVFSSDGVPLYATTHTTTTADPTTGTRHRHHHHVPTQAPLPNIYHPHAHSQSPHIHHKPPTSHPSLHTFSSYPDLHAPPPHWATTSVPKETPIIPPPPAPVDPLAAANGEGFETARTRYLRPRSSSPPLGKPKKTYPKPSHGPHSGVASNVHRRSHHGYNHHYDSTRRRGRSESMGRYYDVGESEDALDDDIGGDGFVDELGAGVKGMRVGDESMDELDVGEGWTAFREKRGKGRRDRERESGRKREWEREWERGAYYA